MEKGEQNTHPYVMFGQYQKKHVVVINVLNYLIRNDDIKKLIRKWPAFSNGN